GPDRRGRLRRADRRGLRLHREHPVLRQLLPSGPGRRGDRRVLQTFFLRGILSPFAHVSFTALAGLGLGIAAERRSLMLYFGLGAGGTWLGMILHALWNGSTFFLPVDPDDALAGFLRYYLTVQVPIFVLLVAIAL